jgi:hypothetical protein
MASAWNARRRHYAYLVASPRLPVLTILVHVPVCVPPAPKAHHSRFRIALPRSSHPASISPKTLASCYARFARVRRRRAGGMPVLRPLSGCPSLCAPVCARILHDCPLTVPRTPVPRRRAPPYLPRHHGAPPHRPLPAMPVPSPPSMLYPLPTPVPPRVDSATAASSCALPRPFRSATT